MRKSYPSDITREQFEVIRPILNSATKTTHPRKYDLYDIFCAVLYLIKEGCSWRAIPHDFPKWENVRYHYDIWAKPDENGFSLLDGILRDLMPIPPGQRDTTQVKKTGIKWHIGVDILGLPHVIMLTAADVTDRDGAVKMFSRYCDATDYLDLLKKVMADGGYTGEKFAQTIKTISGAEVEVVKRNEVHTFVVLPKRWIVERTFGWLDKCRRLWKNCERLLQNSFQMISLAFIRLLLARY